MSWLFWFLAGHSVFGFLVGGLTGLSGSSTVSTVLPLLFTFAGGSVVTLSVGQARSHDTLQLLGQQLVAFGLGTLAGLLVGLLIRKIGVSLPFVPKATWGR